LAPNRVIGKVRKAVSSFFISLVGACSEQKEAFCEWLLGNAVTIFVRTLLLCCDANSQAVSASHQLFFDYRKKRRRWEGAGVISGNMRWFVSNRFFIAR
jgi:hypothetical protein